MRKTWLKEKVRTLQFCPIPPFKKCVQCRTQTQEGKKVGIKNPKAYIIPHSVANSLAHDRQQGFHVEKQGANKSFANYYGGTGDTRSFVWSPKPNHS